MENNVGTCENVLLQVIILIFLNKIDFQQKNFKHATQKQCKIWVQFVKRCFYKPKSTDKNKLFFQTQDSLINTKNNKYTYV